MEDTIELTKPVLGLNNVSPDTDLPDGSLVSATNVNIDKEGNVYSIDGYTRIYEGDIHSLFERYFVEDGILKYLELDNTATTLTSVKPNTYLAWVNTNEKYVYSDGEKLYTVDGKPFGIPTPRSPSVLKTSGELTEGNYQVSIVYKDALTGEIGGSSLALSVSVNDGSGITLLNLPISEYDIEIYSTTPNGTDFYFIDKVSAGTVTYTITTVKEAWKLLKTQYLNPMPGGHIIRKHNAQLLVANCNLLYYSEPFSNLTNIGKNYLRFKEKISVVQSIGGGIFVVADKTYFLTGDDLSKATQKTASDDTGIEGTDRLAHGVDFNLEADIEVGFWYSNKGATLGLPGGIVKSLTEQKLALEENLQRGATFFREKEGIKQMVTSFPNSGSESGFKFETQITATIIRNGVVVE